MHKGYYSAVVLSDDSSHIWHATITNFQRVGVEDLVQLGSLREVFKHKGGEIFGRCSLQRSG